MENNKFESMNTNECFEIMGGAVAGAIVGAIFGGTIGMTGAVVDCICKSEVDPNKIWKGYVTGASTGAAIGTFTPF